MARKSKTATEAEIIPASAGILYGYARVSTADQDLTVQTEALERAGVDPTRIRAEKVSGTSMKGRDELALLLSFMRAGDTLVITRIDRLARSMKDLQDIVHDLKTKGVYLRATEQPIDTGSAAGKAFLDMLGVFAEFETNLRSERQLEGIARAKTELRGDGSGLLKYQGRPGPVTHEEILRLHDDGIGATAIMRQLGLKSRTTVYNAIDARKAKAEAAASA